MDYKWICKWQEWNDSVAYLTLYLVKWNKKYIIAIWMKERHISLRTKTEYSCNTIVYSCVCLLLNWRKKIRAYYLSCTILQTSSRFEIVEKYLLIDNWRFFFHGSDKIYGFSLEPRELTMHRNSDYQRTIFASVWCVYMQ